jgi:hypothetical protein
MKELNKVFVRRAEQLLGSTPFFGMRSKLTPPLKVGSLFSPDAHLFTFFQMTPQQMFRIAIFKVSRYTPSA